MGTEIKHAVIGTDEEAQYDEKAKRLLGQKYILASILIKTVDEFKGKSLEDVVLCIEGEPFISAIPIEPGLTNVVRETHGQRIVGFNSENVEINEGLIRFDIVFYVRMRDGISQIIVNIEAQKDVPTEYKIVNRAIFYISRLISSQKERDFTNTNYDDIKRVFSIWICMNMNENSMDYIHLANEKLLGSCQWEGSMDLLNIILIGLARELPEYSQEYDLHRLLGTLLSIELSVEEKLNIIGTEYHIPIEDDMRKDVNAMCNLGQGIREKGRTEGRREGKQEGRREGRTEGRKEREIRFVMNMYKKGYTLEQIADVAEKSVEEIKTVIESKASATV